ncbi:hypothetical protein SAMN05446037_10872 [Anaerovirgula multivorans]|uniref:Uncharacterized protein n=1 Tax=Anaerovirgula multivorans TaxID=312168 RepID=A0A239LK69_9FIRM|nr:hypothetical protein [Anaerovirgula multivorans]SNT31057.1 hypothetical protein SAMN05446037_10872 [Anaerovirgula multivorans]
MKKNIVSIIICFLVFSTTTGLSVSGLSSEENADIIYHIATEEELERLNELLDKGYSEGEVYEEVLPELFKKLPEPVKESLYDMEFTSSEESFQPTDSSESNDEIITSTYYGVWSELTQQGMSLQYLSGSRHQVTREWYVTRTSLMDSSGTLYGLVLKEVANTNECIVQGILDPPSGTYRTRGDHWWHVIDNQGQDAIFYNVSYSVPRSYTNPNN